MLSKLALEDYQIATGATVEALDAGSDRDWSNPKTGVSGTSKILQTFDAGGHRGCRRVQLEVIVKSHRDHGRYVMCKRASGKWAFYSVSE